MVLQSGFPYNYNSKGIKMNYKNNTQCNNHANTFDKPANVSDDVWFAIDLNDPLMMVC